MELLTAIETGSMPPGVTSISDLKQQKRVSRTLSKAVSLHLEGKLESAARLLAKAIETGERESGIYSALGHIQYEMRDYEGAASVYGQLVEQEPLHRTAHFDGPGARHSRLVSGQDAAASLPANLQNFSVFDQNWNGSPAAG